MAHAARTIYRVGVWFAQGLIPPQDETKLKTHRGMAGSSRGRIPLKKENLMDRAKFFAFMRSTVSSLDVVQELL